ncbi:hypothetical protein ACFLUH_02665 [Chloroflexota bacterium]
MTKKQPDYQDLMLFPQYLENLLNWDLWIDKAETLVAAAGALEPHIRSYWDVVESDAKEGRYSKGGKPPACLQAIYSMLIAYALENLFKAMIIGEQQDTFRTHIMNKGGKLPEKIKSHDLIRLAKEAHFEFNVSDEDLLARLHRNSEWTGRYPVPVSSSGLKNIKVFTTDGKPHVTAFLSPNDIDLLSDLVRRVKTHIIPTLNSSKSIK